MVNKDEHSFHDCLIVLFTFNWNKYFQYVHELILRLICSIDDFTKFRFFHVWMPEQPETKRYKIQHSLIVPLIFVVHFFNVSDHFSTHTSALLLSSFLVLVSMHTQSAFKILRDPILVAEIFRYFWFMP